MKNKLDLGTKLRLARVRAGLSQRQLSAFLGGHPTDVMISHWERGYFKPSKRNLSLIRTFLRLPAQTVRLRMKALRLRKE